MAVLLREDDERITVRDCDLPGVVDGDKETTYTIRPMGEDVRKGIIRRNRHMTANPRTRQMEYPPENSELAEEQAADAAYEMLDYILQGWTNVLFKGSREPIPCTADWKRKAIDPVRQAGLFQLAGVNEVAAAEVRAASFRQPA